MPSAVKLIVGLGNPGSEYADTRHNAGFWFVERFVDRCHGGFGAERKLFCELARVRSGGHDLRVMKPQTWMNESGRAVRAAADYYRIDSGQILVAHDDIDLPAGTVKLKKGGGHGGNTGRRSISQCLPDSGYYRLRIGTGHPGDKERVTAHVLSRPGRRDREAMEAAIQRALEVMPLILDDETGKAMNALHSNDERGATRSATNSAAP